MRPFETFLLAASIPLLLRPFLPIRVRDRPHWTGFVLALLALLTAAHLVFERNQLPSVKA
jgi:hypothetical protein